jgi:soluble lytic murein transglycosylase-like protein
MNTTPWYRELAQDAAARHGLDWWLVEAIVRVESSGNADAFRHEPGFWRRYMQDKPQWREAVSRRVASSYGLMQVMYATAVEHGYVGEPEGLFIPAASLEFGCRYVESLRDWSARNWPQALAAYNAGRGNWQSEEGQAYAEKVLAEFARERR